MKKFNKQREGTPSWERVACRSRDIIFSFLGLLFLAPLFALIAIAIKRDSPGPVFYWGPRLGRNGIPFKMLKFRTMYERPETYKGPRVTAGDDPRRTPIGKWLRDTKINELPQLWNVLVGDMSLVGPRPEDPKIAEEWPDDLRREILSIRPGITSPATVLHRDEESILNSEQIMDDYFANVMPSKLRLEQIYVRNRAFWIDMDVLFWTMLVLLPQLRSYKPPENLLFWGPLAKLFTRYLNWFSVDTITTFLSFGVASLFWRSFGPLDIGWYRMLGYSIVFSLLFSVVGAFMGIQRIYWSKTSGNDVVYLAPPLFVATTIILIFNTVIRQVLPYGLVVVASGIAGLGFVFVRYRTRLMTGFASRLLSRWNTPEIARERILVVGGGYAGQTVAWMLNNDVEDGSFHVMGFVDDDLYKQQAQIRGVRVLGKCDDIPRLVDKHDVGIIVFAIHNISSEGRKEILEICRQTSLPVVEMPDFLSRLRTVSSILHDIEDVRRTINANGKKSSQEGELL